MPIRKYTIDPPFVRLPGDVFVKNGTSYEQWRGEVLVDSRDLTNQSSELLTAAEVFGSNEIGTLYLEDFGTTGDGDMIWIEIDTVTHGDNGALSLTYTGSVSGAGGTIGWPDLEQIQLAVGGPININSEEGVILLHMARWLALDANLDNEELVLGKRLTVDVSALNIITVE